MSVKEQMLKARELIKAKRYEEARKILRQIDHPTAEEWLDKLDSIAPQKSRQPGRADGRRSALPVLIGLLMAALLVAMAVIWVLPALRPTPGESLTVVPTQASLAGGESTVNTATESTASSDADDTAQDAAGSLAVGSGLRVPFSVTYGVITVELPNGWRCNCAGGLSLLETTDGARASVSARLVPNGLDMMYFADKPLSEALAAQISDEETVTAQETVQAGEREVLVASVADEDSRIDRRYFVKDSSGYVAVFEIPYYVDEPEQIYDEVLLMLATVEAQSGPDSLDLPTELRAHAVAYNDSLNRWRLADALGGSSEHFVELPPDWTISSGMIGNPVAQLSDTTILSETAIVRIPATYYSFDDTVDAILTQFAGGDEVREQALLQANGRDVAYALFIDTGSGGAESANYLTRDSDGDVVAFIIQPSVPDKAALREGVLFMAGNIETEPVNYVETLRRAGLLPAPEGENDGYITVTLN